MQTAESPMTGAQKLWPRSSRTPLQLKNSPATPMVNRMTKTKPKQEWMEILGHPNKENHPPIPAGTEREPEPLDALLAEELNAIKQKLERLRSDRERTERMLKERDMVLDGKMKELERKGEFQKNLEMEVDRLFRLKEHRSGSVVRTENT